MDRVPDEDEVCGSGRIVSESVLHTQPIGIGID